MSEEATHSSRDGRDGSAKRCRVEAVPNLTELFESGLERLNAAQTELNAAQENMKEIRRLIRNGGCFEPDSLLYLGDGEDNPLICHIMRYLAVKDVGKCESVCSTLKELSKTWYEEFEETNLNPTCRSPSAHNCRERVVRYHLASNLARNIGALGDKISNYLVTMERRGWTGETYRRRVAGFDESPNWHFPDLDFDVLRRGRDQDYELFVRFSRTGDNKLFGEGFVPHSRDESCINMNLEKFDFSKWQQMLEISRLVETMGGAFAENHHNLLNNCMTELTATVVAVHKATSRVSLLIAQRHFGDSGGLDHGIDNMGSYGYCWPKGEVTPLSHGHFDGDVHSVAYLGMLFDTRTWTGREDGRILRECFWTLECSYELRGDVLTIGDVDDEY